MAPFVVASPILNRNWEPMERRDKDKLLIELATKVEIMEKNYVSKHEFYPIKIFVYGTVTLCLGGILAGLLKLVLGS